MAQTTSFSPRLGNVFYYPGKHWTNTMNFNTQQASQQESKYYSELDERLNYFYLGTWPNEAIWVDTSASKGWFAWFRFYAPTEAFFSKNWQLPDFDPV